MACQSKGSEPFTRLFQFGTTALSLNIEDINNISVIDSFNPGSLNGNAAWYSPGPTAIDRTAELIPYCIVAVNIGLWLVDISDPTDLSVTDSLTSQDNKLANASSMILDVGNSNAYLAMKEMNRFSRYNYSDPTDLTFTDTHLNPLGSANKVTSLSADFEDASTFYASGNNVHREEPVFGNSYPYGIGNTISIANTDPYISSGTGFSDHTRFDPVTKIIYGLDYANDSMWAVDVSANTASNAGIVLADSIRDTTNIASPVTCDIDLTNRLFFTYSRFGYVSAIDFTDPTNLVLKDTLLHADFVGGNNQSKTIRCDPVRQLLFLTGPNQSRKIKVIDYSDPTSLDYVVSFTTPSADGNGHKIELS